MKKRPDGRYKVSATIGGKRRYFYGRTIKEAEQRRDQFKNALHAAPNVDYNITLGSMAVDMATRRQGNAGRGYI